MTLTKKKMVREIGRRTRLTNKDIQDVVETLVDVWTKSLVVGEKIEIQNFLVLEVREIDRRNQSLFNINKTPQRYKKVILRVSKALKARLD